MQVQQPTTSSDQGTAGAAMTAAPAWPVNASRHVALPAPVSVCAALVAVDNHGPTAAVMPSLFKIHSNPLAYRAAAGDSTEHTAAAVLGHLKRQQQVTCTAVQPV